MPGLNGNTKTVIRTSRVTGLMSGSSMDGVDLACCEFTFDGSVWRFEVLAAETLPYPSSLRIRLEESCHWSREEIGQLDLELGRFYGHLLNEFHASNGLDPDLISSHGHTVLHEPERGITLQAGDGGTMTDITGITVVNDFRSADVAQGGQGAPLVPVGDRLLFGTYDACLNIGGIANISYEGKGSRRIAYDLCPANMALNWIAALRGLPMDEGGAMAREGITDRSLVAALNNLEYYSKEPPKSLGREWFLEQLLPEMKRAELTPEDLMATLVEHIALQCALGINRAGVRSVLLTGGGALNQTLVERLRYHAPVRIEIPDLQMLKFKEAVIFAFLGLLRIRGEHNCLASVTGGKEDLSTGTIHSKTK